MKKTVYIETTVPSFYFDGRENCSWRQDRTREWWDSQRAYFDCYTSYFTHWEIEKAEFPNQENVMALTQQLPILPFSDDIEEIIEIYVKNFVMPKDALGDAAHLAIASLHSIDYLLTWNCKHLANAFKFAHIQKINLRLGLFTPMIVTPEQLFLEEDE